MKSIIPITVCALVAAAVSLAPGCAKNNPSSPAGPTATPVPTVCGILAGDSLNNDNDNISNGMVAAVSFTASNNATLTSLTSKLNGSTGFIAMGVYADNAGSPGMLLVETLKQTPVSGWNSVTVTPLSITSGGNYWMALYSAGVGLSAVDGPYSKVLSFSYTSGLPSNATGWSGTGAGLKMYASGCY